MSAAKKAPKKEAKTHAPAPEQSGNVIAIIGGKPISARGRSFTGRVVSDRMTKTVTVEWERQVLVPKYQRYERRRTRVKAHDETGAKIGDLVEIVETRPISKTKNFIVTKKLS